MAITFIYFDVGGVVVKDFSKTNKWEQLVEDLGVNKVDVDKFNTEFDSEENGYYVNGAKDPKTFPQFVKLHTNIQLPPNYDFCTDIVSRTEPNPQLAQLISKYRPQYEMGLLTNMYIGLLDELYKAGLMPNVEWDVIVDSSKIGLQKPQPEIFEYAQKKAGVPANEILYVENTQGHIDSALTFGWNCVLYDPLNVEKSNRKIVEILENA